MRAKKPRGADDESNVRPWLLLIAAAAGACGNADSGRLVSADVAPSRPEGCVAPDARPAKGTKRATWLVREGDSLRRIAKKVYGDENQWKAIRDANPSRVAANGAVAPGAELVIPFDGI
jgi:nucleoid-associated protein YgaU